MKKISKLIAFIMIALTFSQSNIAFSQNKLDNNFILREDNSDILINLTKDFEFAKSISLKSEDIVIGPGTITYPLDSNSITASSEWLNYNVTLNLPPLDEGESLILTLGDNWDTSKNIINLGNYTINPVGYGKFQITAKVDTASISLDLNLLLRYRFNITDDQQQLFISPCIHYENTIITGDNVPVNVKKYIEYVPSEELMKKVAIGKTSTGNAAWIIYWNYNNKTLCGNDEFPFIFEDSPFNGQKIITNSILVYDVNNPINNDESRNLDHDDYNYQFSSFLQSKVTPSGGINITSQGDDDYLTEYYKKAFYIYFETTVPSNLHDTDILNKIDVKSISEDGIYLESTSLAGISDTPESSAEGTLKVSVEKIWNDSGNQDGIRPDSIQVQLYINDIPDGYPIELSEDNNWTYTWTNLELEASSNVYTVKELAVPQGYTNEYIHQNAGKTLIINTHESILTECIGQKFWNDNNNQNGKRPTTITVNLLADEIIVDSKVISADDSWMYSFLELDKYKDGKEISYSVTEDIVPDYTTTIVGYDITNSYSSTESSSTESSSTESSSTESSSTESSSTESSSTESSSTESSSTESSSTESSSTESSSTESSSTESSSTESSSTESSSTESSSTESSSTESSSTESSSTESSSTESSSTESSSTESSSTESSSTESSSTESSSTESSSTESSSTESSSTESSSTESSSTESSSTESSSTESSSTESSSTESSSTESSSTESSSTESSSTESSSTESSSTESSSTESSSTESSSTESGSTESSSTESSSRSSIVVAQKNSNTTKGNLPKTGEKESYIVTLCGLFLMILGLYLLNKRNDNKIN